MAETETAEPQANDEVAVGTELVRDFVNTRDLLDGIEGLASPGELVTWLEARGLTRGPVTATPAELRRALELREALRQVLLKNTGLEVDREAAFAVIDRTARRARIELCFEECAGALTPAATGIDAALGRIVIAVHSAMADGSWERLKACRASDCEWAFIDNARNHSRAWCSMRSCGNREKARAFRERHRAI
ncbi:MAG TPA: CGNR zinc finger domain-containing protein [Gaiellaceae bacterium]|nr:CGNR zinc finger domain-containing protein [Gaiellaceae bacterium]